MTTGNKLILGCSSILLLLASTIMWLCMFYGVLDQVGAKPWIWGVYWAYVPTNILVVTLSGIIQNTKTEG